jgi:serine/threonine protein kinase
MFCAGCGKSTETSPCGACGQESLLNGRYRLEEVLGEGAFGTTYRALAPDKSTVAIKEMTLQLEQRENVQREIRILRELDHRGIPSYIDDFISHSGRRQFQMLVQEFVDGQTLAQEFESKRYSPEEVVTIIEEVAGILSYLHGLSPPVIHRDIKPANIMRTKDGRLFLIDFGQVRESIVGTLGATREVGTMGYHAPEQFTGDPLPASDLFSLGAVAVHLLTRMEPQNLADNLYDKMKWQEHTRLPAELAALVDHLVEPEVGCRLGSASQTQARACQIRQAIASGRTPFSARKPTPKATLQADSSPVIEEGRPARFKEPIDPLGFEAPPELPAKTPPLSLSRTPIFLSALALFVLAGLALVVLWSPFFFHHESTPPGIESVFERSVESSIDIPLEGALSISAWGPVVPYEAVSVIKSTMPQYPKKAKHLKLGEQKCRVQVAIDETGAPAHIVVHDCPAVFHEPTKEALTQWRMRPFVLDGFPTKAQFTVEVKYKLEGHSNSH